jgi:hypothetical protein
VKDGCERAGSSVPELQLAEGNSVPGAPPRDLPCIERRLTASIASRGPLGVPDGPLLASIEHLWLAARVRALAPHR